MTKSPLVTSNLRERSARGNELASKDDSKNLPTGEVLTTINANSTLQKTSYKNKSNKNRIHNSKWTTLSSRGIDLVHVVIFFLTINFVASLVATHTLTWGISPRKIVLKITSNPRIFTMEELSNFDGKDPKRPIYLAIKGQVFDVSKGRRFYGPAGDYHVFTGKDASRSFATGCFEKDTLTHDLRGLSNEELGELDRWYEFYTRHRDYDVIGKVILPAIPADSALPIGCPPLDLDQEIEKQAHQPSAKVSKHAHHHNHIPQHNHSDNNNNNNKHHHNH